MRCGDLERWNVNIKDLKSDSIGPNTNLPRTRLKSNVLICAGESSVDLLRIIASRTNQSPGNPWEYRCYRFWDFDEFLLVWTGFGTGCLEPLLYELLKPTSEHETVIRQIILIGTAGRLANDRQISRHPKAYCIDKAYFGPTGLQAFQPGDCVRPSHDGILSLPTAAIISTDAFYLFTDPKDVLDAVLRQKLQKYWTECALIDMEVAQFYYLCERFSRQFGPSSLSYVAIKSPSNDVGNAEQQIRDSQAALDLCIQSALELMNVP